MNKAVQSCTDGTGSSQASLAFGSYNHSASSSTVVAQSHQGDYAINVWKAVSFSGSKIISSLTFQVFSFTQQKMHLTFSNKKPESDTASHNWTVSFLTFQEPKTVSL